MRRITGLAACLTLALAVTAAAGPDAVTLDARAAAIDAAAAEPDGVRVVAGHLSRKLVVSFEILQAQRAQLGLGWGQLLVAHYLAREATVPVEQVAGERHGGKPWAAIAADHHLDLGALTAEVQKSQEAIEQRSDDRPRPAAPGSPSSAGGGKGRGKGGGGRRQMPQ